MGVFGMNRRVKRYFRFAVLGLLGYLLYRLGAASAGPATLSHSTNAFLFLCGLSGVYALLSPPSRRMRLRY
jgi:hypothetical protein